MNQDFPFERIEWRKVTEKEFIGRCPFCGDSAKHPTHGHLYISKKFPFFRCFRCSKSGPISLLEAFLKETCKYVYNDITEKELIKVDISQMLDDVDTTLRMASLQLTDQELNYFKSRCKIKALSPEGIVKYGLISEASVKPIISQYYKSNDYRTWTMRGFGTGVSGRAHSNDDSRYYNQSVDIYSWTSLVACDTYFIRNKVIKKYNPKNIPQYLIIAEGIYDIVPLYLRRNKYFLDEDIEDVSIFMASQSSAYERCVKVFKFMYNTIPKNIIVFADDGISPRMLSSQFKDFNSRIKVNWPMVKDWEEYGPIKTSIEL